MTETDAQKIARLCDTWRTAAMTSNRIVVGAEHERLRLLANGIQFHLLDFDALRTASVGLCGVHLLPRRNVVESVDHYMFWAWCGEVLLSSLSPYAGALDPEVGQLMRLAVRTALVPAPAETPEGARREAEMLSNLAPNPRFLISETGHLLGYLAFPLLEAIVKLACKQHLTLAGGVIKDFDGKSRSYKSGKICSNVVDMIYLLVNEVADQDLKDDIIKIIGFMAECEAEPDGLSVLHTWRNSSVHGEVALPTIGGAVATLALRIALQDIASDYDEIRANIARSFEHNVQRKQRSGHWMILPSTYYPAFARN
ncbi:hypothetical protein [Paractinoplanes rishiriensis]|uniref:Uncharacterized protein n=1 Tax=Paractinoplanes rishiriensis TaxID=1050105 RepID=A0A919K914_9ACTN|nr:hypothetical protein [Actinoplanes rishiriensis]GIF01970.1 hypothetical protein Ari01nite_94340 [Actinoplanes rishiriensis]